jgi:hypothetical protein
VRVQRQHDASYTRAKRGHNAKDNVTITRNNADGWHTLQPVGAAYALNFRELLPDRERNSKNGAQHQLTANWPPGVTAGLPANADGFQPASSPARASNPARKGGGRTYRQLTDSSQTIPLSPIGTGMVALKGHRVQAEGIEPRTPRLQLGRSPLAVAARGTPGVIRIRLAALTGQSLHATSCKSARQDWSG